MPAFVIVIAVVVAVFAFNAVRLAKKSSSHHFDCPECGVSFQVSFFNYMFTAHSFGGKCSVKCPKCGKTNMLTAVKGRLNA
ncbi:MAG: hypothetical protein FWG42_07240 [Clostridiales bacterium]|nr:hypothetical protein [Clostridiales bacterium]